MATSLVDRDVALRHGQAAGGHSPLRLRHPFRAGNRKRLLGPWRLCAFLVLIVLGSWVASRHARDNFHQVVRHKVYRSGQMNVATLNNRVSIHRIRGIINLRGPNPQAEWYQAERAFTLAAGIPHFDLMLSAQNAPTSGELKELIRILEESPRPVLIHCESGTDRTGLGVAVCLLLDETSTMQVIERQLGIRYGHAPWSLGSLRAREFLGLYADWLREQGQTHRPANFRRWASQVYRRPERLGGPDWPSYPPWQGTGGARSSLIMGGPMNDEALPSHRE